LTSPRDAVRLAGVAPRAGSETTGPRLIDQRIRDLGGWRGETLARMRALILEADPEMTEEVKWVKPSSGGTPVWSHDGMVCTGEAYTNVVKLTFPRGASLPDPSRLFKPGRAPGYRPARSEQDAVRGARAGSERLDPPYQLIPLLVIRGDPVRERIQHPLFLRVVSAEDGSERTDRI
jgi:hypothetical protein